MHKRSRNFTVFLGLTILLLSCSLGSAKAASVFINEIHYDNTGAATGEAIEIAGQTGTDLTGWSVVLYNGNNGAVYNTINLSGSFANEQNGFGTLAFFQPGIQNGAPDGLALVDATNSVVQFLSYEGSFTALAGPANGLTSTNIGVIEPSNAPIGHSLQLTGSGTDSSNFTWITAMANTFGAVNTGQTFTGGSQRPVPEPSTLLFLSSGLIGLSIWRWKQQHRK